MQLNSVKTLLSLATVVLVLAMAGQAQAKPWYGAGCIGCHDEPPGDMTGDDVTAFPDVAVTLSFGITEMYDPGKGSVKVDLDDLFGAGNFSLGAGWTEEDDGGDLYWCSDFFSSPAPQSVDLALTVGAGVAPGVYNGLAELGGGADDGHLTWGNSTTAAYSVTVVPEPSTLLILTAGLAAVAMMVIRRRRKA